MPTVEELLLEIAEEKRKFREEYFKKKGKGYAFGNAARDFSTRRGKQGCVEKSSTHLSEESRDQYPSIKGELMTEDEYRRILHDRALEHHNARKIMVERHEDEEREVRQSYTEDVSSYVSCVKKLHKRHQEELAEFDKKRGDIMKGIPRIFSKGKPHIT